MRLRICKQIRAEAFWFTKMIVSVQLLRDLIWLNSGITHKTFAWFTKLLEGTILWLWVVVPHRNLPVFSSQLPCLSPANHLRHMAWGKDLKKSSS